MINWKTLGWLCGKVKQWRSTKNNCLPLHATWPKNIPWPPWCARKTFSTYFVSLSQWKINPTQVFCYAAPTLSDWKMNETTVLYCTSVKKCKKCLFFFNVCCLLQPFNYTSLSQSCDPLGDQGFKVTSMNKIIIIILACTAHVSFPLLRQGDWTRSEQMGKLWKKVGGEGGDFAF